MAVRARLVHRGGQQAGTLPLPASASLSTPISPSRLRELIVQGLKEQHGEASGGAAAAVDWSTLRLVHSGATVDESSGPVTLERGKLVAILPPNYPLAPAALASPDDSSGKCAYELERDANIRRNELALAALGVPSAHTGLAAATAQRPPRKRRRREETDSPPPPPRRSTRRPAASSGSGSPTSQSITETAVRRRPAPAPAPAAPAAPARPPPAPAYYYGGGNDFAWRVLQVMKAIPVGKVAAYGQVAGLAGSPRNARQVGKLLAAGLAAGGAPWQRVINSAGGISLPPAAGGDRQRRLLGEEGVGFRASGKVLPEAWWAPDPEALRDQLFRS